MDTSSLPPPPPSERTPDLVLTSAPFELVLPNLCARCGEPATQHLAWERAFQEYSGDSYTYAIVSARAPFCPRCLVQHHREAKPMPAWLRLLQCFRSEAMIPAVLSAGFGLWLVPKLWPQAGRATDWVDWAVPAAVAGFTGLIAFGSWLAARDATRHRTVTPLTTITASSGFHVVKGELFEGERYRYTTANLRFYEALRAANEGAVWSPSGERVHAAANKRVALYVLMGAGFLVFLSWDWLMQWKRWEW